MQAANRPGADAVGALDIAGPRHVAELAGRASHPCDFHMTAEARKRPQSECSSDPGCSVLLTGERGAAPLIAAVKKPDA